jgi:anti-sigma factor RsiW
MQRRMPLMLTCRELEAFIVDYLDGNLPVRQRFVFRLHLILCRECRSYLASYERAIAISKAVCQDATRSIPEDIPEDLVRAIVAARGSSEE